MHNSMYFGEPGILATHAKHIKNLCKEVIQQDVYKTDNVNIVNSSVKLIESESSTDLSLGDKDLNYIIESAKRMEVASSLSAWLGEAIKARDQMLYNLDVLSIDDYCKMFNKELPKHPYKTPKVDEDFVIGTFNKSKRVNYLIHETNAATYGKMVHPNGAIAKMRLNALTILQNPAVVTGSGRDMIITNRALSVDIKVIEDLYFTLQQLHSDAQNKLNVIKADILKTVNLINCNNNNLYEKEKREYDKNYESLMSEKLNYVIMEKEKINNLKIVIPEELQSFYNFISSISK